MLAAARHATRTAPHDPYTAALRKVIGLLRLIACYHAERRVVRLFVPPSAVAVIPARFHSTRLPGKALADIAGRAMIEHVYRRAAAASSIARVIVATDDRRIVDAVERFGGEARLTSPSHESGTDRLAEVAASLDCA